MIELFAKNPVPSGPASAAAESGSAASGSTPAGLSGPSRNNPSLNNPKTMDDFTDGIVNIGAVAAGNAVTDEVVEALSNAYGEDKSVVVAFLIEAGVPVATGVGSHYVTENQIARNVGIGMIAQGSVNGARILVQQIKDMMSDSDGSGGSETQGLSGRLTPAQRSAVQGLNPPALAGFKQLSASQQQQAARQLVSQQKERERQDGDPEERRKRLKSGTLGSNRQSAAAPQQARHRSRAGQSVRSA